MTPQTHADLGSYWGPVPFPYVHDLLLLPVCIPVSQPHIRASVDPEYRPNQRSTFHTAMRAHLSDGKVTSQSTAEHSPLRLLWMGTLLLVLFSMRMRILPWSRQHRSLRMEALTFRTGLCTDASYTITLPHQGGSMSCAQRGHQDFSTTLQARHAEWMRCLSSAVDQIRSR